MIQKLKKALAYKLIICAAINCIGQSNRTVGLLAYDKKYSYEGLNLFFPRGAANVYLINNCGQIVHTWLDSSKTGPNQSAYLQNDGSIFMAKDSEPDTVLQFTTGNEKIEHRDWDNNLLWSFIYSASPAKPHHDFKVLPNGNILLIAWEVKTEQDALSSGRKQSLLPRNRIISEQIVEIEPTGKYSGEIVWEWHAWNHLIQNNDSSKKNYGEVKSHPELIDFNYKTYSTKDDWLHINSIDYDKQRDLILLSISAFNEIWIIDHSTNSVEATSHRGGNFKKGGDLIWRWGNPEAYGMGDSTLKKLYFQHNAHWVKNEVGSKTENNESIILFNNFYPDSASAVCVVTPIFNTTSSLFEKRKDIFLPETYDWTYTTEQRSKMFSPIGSSVQLLPNGNLLICVGKKGYAFEVAERKNIVWEYVVPTKMGIPVKQGTSITPSDNRTFRMERYPTSWLRVSEKLFKPQFPLETFTDTAFCNSLHYIDCLGKRIGLYVYWNQTAKQISIALLMPLEVPIKLLIKDSQEKSVTDILLNKPIKVKVDNWKKGKYAIYVEENFVSSFTYN